MKIRLFIPKPNRRVSLGGASQIFLAVIFGAVCLEQSGAFAGKNEGIPLATALPPKPAHAGRALPAEIDAGLVLEGRKLFHDEANCFHCHGKNGTGTFFGPSLNDDRRLNLQTAGYEEINRLIHTGVPKPKRHLGAMPPKGGAVLSEAQIRALAAYVFTLDRGP